MWCEQEEQRNHYENGYNNGFASGQRVGAIEGEREGLRDGEQKGLAEGEKDGVSDAQNDARRTETDKGRARGVQQADSQTAAIQARAQREGEAAGAKEAVERARAEDYQKGRSEYRQSQFQLRPRFSESYSLADGNRPISRLTPGSDDNRLWLLAQSGLADNLTNHQPANTSQQAPAQDIDIPEPEKSAPSYSGSRGGSGFPTNEEQNAYNNAYRQAYQDGWRRAYRAEYRRVYRAEFRSAQHYGCEQARRRDYWQFYQEGQEKGEREGRKRAYDERYPVSFESARRRVYHIAYDDAYRGELPLARKRVFETERQEAFDQREREIYEVAFAQARQKRFTQDYPAIQRHEYDKGLSDEATDFAARPVRLLEASVAETIKDGLLEPGEDLFLRFSLRNFSNTAINPADLRIVAQGSDGAVNHESQITLGRELRGLSINEISEALVLRLPEYSLQEDYAVTLKAFYLGVPVGEEKLTLRARYSTTIGFDKPLTLAEGLPGIYKFTVTNQSNRPTPQDTRLALKTPETTNVEAPVEINIGSLAPGEIRTLEFPLLTRTDKPTQTIPFDARVETGARRIGRAVAEVTFPVRNDYKATVVNNGATLKRAGLQRLVYQITNNSSAKGRSLQVSLRFAGENADNFKLPGVNPQYLGPVAPGQTVSFAAPVTVTQPDVNGVLEIEVREEGRPVVIRRVRF